MYYSKSTGNTINIPRNYSGNTFRVIDETERSRAPSKEHNPSIESHNIESNFDKNINSNINKELSKTCDHSQNKQNSPSAISSILSGISLEDLLLLGLIFVIHQENPNDSTLLLLLILLLAK